MVESWTETAVTVTLIGLPGAVYTPALVIVPFPVVPVPPGVPFTSHVTPEPFDTTAVKSALCPVWTQADVGEIVTEIGGG